MIGAAFVAAVLFGLVASTAPTWPVTEAVLLAMGQALVAADPTPARVDAVAVHGGGGARGEREHRALELLRDGVTEQVVAMGGRLPVGDPDLTYARAVERRLLARDVSPSSILRFDVGRSTQGSWSRCGGWLRSAAGGHLLWRRAPGTPGGSSCSPGRSLPGPVCRYQWWRWTVIRVISEIGGGTVGGGS